MTAQTSAQDVARPSELAAECLDAADAEWGGWTTVSKDASSVVLKHIAAALQAERGRTEALREMSATFPEINLGNYNDNDVTNLNNWGIAVCGLIDALAAPDTGIFEERDRDALFISSGLKGEPTDTGGAGERKEDCPLCGLEGAKGHVCSPAFKLCGQ
jgi:hypothetical protein